MKTLRKVLASLSKADEAFNLIEKGDKIAVGFSGGKDSMALIVALDRYRHYAKKDFEFIAIHLDLGFPMGRPPHLEEFCARYGVKLIIKDDTFVYDILKSHVRKGEGKHLPCSLCSRIKKAAICEAAKEEGITKIAFAHHLDDSVETFMMNLLHAGMAYTFSPKTYLDRKGVTFIRPLVYARENDLSRLAKEENFPEAIRVCPSDGLTERTRIKGFLKEIYDSFPQSRDNLALSLIDHKRFGLLFDQGSDIKEGYRLEAVTTVERALLLPHRPPKDCEDHYLLYKDGKLLGQVSTKKKDAHVYEVKGIHAPKEARKLIIEHFEWVLQRKTSPMTLIIKGLSKEEKESLGYIKSASGDYRKRLI